MDIRLASLLDLESIREIHQSAFPAEERELVATLAVNLLDEKTLPETFAFVAEADGQAVGHIAFSPISLADSDNLQGYILAPLAVRPVLHKQGIGTALIEAGIQHLLALKTDILFVYGDPKYYGRFGFTAEAALAYAAPYPLQYEFGWQAKPLAATDTFASSGQLTCVASLQDPQLW